MRRGSSTVITIVGDVTPDLLDRLGRSSNVSVLEAPATGGDGAREALTRAGRQQTPYCIVPADPMANVADEWLKMWSPGASAHHFEERAGEAIAAWRRGQLELPDYYLVVVPGPPGQVRDEQPQPHPQEFHLGVLKSQRPGRVAEVMGAQLGETAARALHALAALPHGPWWPGIDALIASMRSFFPGGLAAGGDGASYGVPVVVPDGGPPAIAPKEAGS